MSIEQTARTHTTTTTTTATAAVAARSQARTAEARVERLRAPFSLRCGALLVDYTLVAAVLAFTTMLARLYGGGARWGGTGLLTVGYTTAAALAVLNFVVLAGLSGRTVGKWVTGLRIERRDGRPLSFPRALVRHVFGYALTLATLGLGFLVSVFGSEGRALHDFVAGTVVVRHRRRARPRATTPTAATTTTRP